MVDKERDIMSLGAYRPSQEVARGYAAAMVTRAKGAIPDGFIIRCGYEMTQSFDTCEPRCDITMELRLGDDWERRTVRLTTDEGDMLQWASDAAKAMAHVLLMRAQPYPTTTPPPPQE